MNVKKTFAVFCALLCVAFASQAGMIDLSISSVSTNAAAISSDQVTTPLAMSGYFDAIILDLGGLNVATVDVDVVTVPSLGTGPSRTILSIDSVTADGTYFPREILDTTAGVDITGEPAMIPLAGDKIRLDVYDSQATTNGSVWIRAYLFTTQ